MHIWACLGVVASRQRSPGRNLGLGTGFEFFFPHAKGDRTAQHQADHQVVCFRRISEHWWLSICKPLTESNKARGRVASKSQRATNVGPDAPKFSRGVSLQQENLHLESLSIARNHPKPSQEFSEQFGPSIRKMKGFSSGNSPQKVHPNFAQNLGRQILGNTFSGLDTRTLLFSELYSHKKLSPTLFKFV